MKADVQSTSNGLADICGTVATGCAEAAGVVQTVIETSAEVRAHQADLSATVARLATDQGRMHEASREARQLSAQATAHLDQGMESIGTSLTNIS